MGIDFGKIFLLCGTGPATNKAIEAACMLAKKMGISIEAHFMGSSSSDSIELKYLADYSQSQQLELETHVYDHSKWKEICKKWCQDSRNLVIVADVDEYLLSTNKKNGLEILKMIKHMPLLYVRYHKGALFEKILCPIMRDPQSKEKIKRASLLAEIFRSTIYIYGVGRKNDWQLDTYIRQAERHLVEKEIKHTTKNEVSMYPAKSIAKYADEIDAGLIIKSRDSSFRLLKSRIHLEVFTKSNKSMLLFPEEYKSPTG